MKKQLLLCAALLTAAVIAKAQKSDTAQVLVHYKFTHLRDTTNRANPHTENMVLFVGKNAGAYRSYDRQLQNQLFKKQMEEAMANSPDGHVQIRRNVTGSATVYFEFPNDRKLIRKEDMFGAYIIDETMPAMDWKITADTASFGELHCQKATTHFKGRDYIAWFCPDLPVRVGPWKLNGLPGVIVDAHDTKNEVIFKFDGVEKVAYVPVVIKQDQGPPPGQPGERKVMVGMNDLDEDPNLIQVPVNGTQTTDSEFKHMQEILQKDPDAFARMLMANQAPAGPGNGPPPDRIRIKVGPPPIINNPIELTEQ
jgi:GLPGLI family protein